MKVKCIREMPKEGDSNKNIVEWSKNIELEITEGKMYVVLAIAKYLDNIFYYILGDESNNYPLAFPSELFKIVDNRISKYWLTDLKNIISSNDLKIKNSDIISFKEWAENKDIFYENLLEERDHEVKVFNAYRDKMQLE
jgi:hypothetical protein